MRTGEQRARVSIVLGEIRNGGVERCLLNLARGFVEREVATDLIVRHPPTDLGGEIAPGVNLVEFNERTGHLESLAESVSKTGPPVAMLAAKENDAQLMFALRERLGAPAILIASLDYTGQLDGRGAGPFRRWARYRSLRRHYRRADRIFCVSRGVADDMARILRPDTPCLTVVPNPVVTPELRQLADAPLNDPWFLNDEPPVVLGVGRLSLIKNFPLLVRAFARVHGELDARLVILGEGKQRASLFELGKQLGLDDVMALPGHVTNPYPYMKRAGLFVLSSLWEGFGNVLVEALACGTPVVATDCRSGPAEILQDGRYGSLVPAGDETALADAMIRTLRTPPSREFLEHAAVPYSLARSVDAYLGALGIGKPRTAA